MMQNMNKNANRKKIEKSKLKSQPKFFSEEGVSIMKQIIDTQLAKIGHEQHLAVTKCSL